VVVGREISQELDGLGPESIENSGVGDHQS
jgi:hypothetical protein